MWTQISDSAEDFELSRLTKKPGFFCWITVGAAILPKSKLQSSERKTYALTNNKGKELSLDFEAVWLNTPQRPVHFQQLTDFLAGYREDL